MAIKSFSLFTLIIMINSAFSQNPKAHDVTLDNGMKFINQNKFELALEEFKKVIANDSMGYNGIAHNEIGYVYLKQKDFDKALTWFMRSKEINPNYPKSRQNIALAYLMKKDIENALSALNEFINELPGWPPAYYQRGNIYEFQGDMTKALRDYKTALFYNKKLNILPKEIVEILKQRD